MNHIEDYKLYFKNMYEIGDIDPNIWLSNYLIDRLELNENQILWFVFLNSITYHLPTAYLIINEYPDLELIDEDRLRTWWSEVQYKCPFQKDKLKQRKFLPDTILSYQKLLNGKQQNEFFNNILNNESSYTNFDILWNILYKDIQHFGRFSVWNWAQMLKHVCGYNIEPSSLFLGDKNAESHTHGICMALGKFDWSFKERYTDENGNRKKKVHIFTQEEKQFLELESDNILSDIQNDLPQSDKYLIETVACAFKKLFRTNDSRYLGYYLDRQAEDIRSIENNGFNGVDWSILWDARNELLTKEFINDFVNKRKFKLELRQKIVNYEKINLMEELF